MTFFYHCLSFSLHMQRTKPINLRLSMSGVCVAVWIRVPHDHSLSNSLQNKQESKQKANISLTKIYNSTAPRLIAEIPWGALRCCLVNIIYRQQKMHFLQSTMTFNQVRNYSFFFLYKQISIHISDVSNAAFHELLFLP